MAGSRKGVTDIAPAIRGAFLKALEIHKERHNKTFPETMADWLEENPIALMNAVAKFTIQEKHVSGNLKHDHTHKHEGLQNADSRITDLLRQGETATNKAPKPH